MKRQSLRAVLCLLVVCAATGVAARARPASAWADQRLYVPIVSRSGAPPGGVTILSSQYSYIVASSLEDALHIVGEVLNNTGEDLANVQVSAILYDAYGVELAQDSSPIYLDNLPAGQKTCFHLLFSPLIETWSYYELLPPDYQSGGDPWPNLTVTDLDSQYAAPDPDLTLVGTIANQGAQTIQFVDVVGTLYNRASKVVGCNKIAIFSLDPGESAPVNLLFTGRDYGDVNQYRLQSDGIPK